MKHTRKKNITEKKLMKAFIAFCTVLFALYPNFTSSQTTINSVKFIGPNKIISVGSSGSISKSNNNGDTWTSQNSQSSDNLHGVAFANEYIGFASGDNGTILKTINGGANWISVTTATNENLNDLYLLPGNRNFITCGDNGKLMVSDNSTGESWSTVISGTSNNLNSVFFLDARNGFVVGDNSTLLKTTDGRNWNLVEIPIGNRNFKTMYAFDENNIIIAGEMGAIFITNDGGISWYNADLPNYELNFNHITFYSNTLGIIAADNGLILMTEDGGITWNPSNSNLAATSNNSLYSVAFTNGKYGMCAGKNGVQVYTNDGGLTWNRKTQISTNLTIKSTNFVLGQNYPNPFNPTTNISYSLPFDGNVSLKVYDMMGKEITSLVNKYINAGTYTAKFDGSNLSSGIYFYVLKAVNGSQEYSKTMKMILTK